MQTSNQLDGTVFQGLTETGNTETTWHGAARAVGLFLGTTQGQELFRRNHHFNDTRILAVPESEPTDFVIADHLNHGADTVVAIFFPDCQGSKHFDFFRWEMSSKQAPGGWCAVEGMTLGTGPQGHASSIGVVTDMMKTQRFILLDDGPRDDVPDVSALLRRMSSQAFAASQRLSLIQGSQNRRIIRITADVATDPGVWSTC